MSNHQSNGTALQNSENSARDEDNARKRRSVPDIRGHVRLPVVSMVIGGLALLFCGFLLLDVVMHPFGMRVGHILLGVIPATIAFNRIVAVLQKLSDRHFNRAEDSSKRSIWPKLLRVTNWLGTPFTFLFFMVLIELSAQHAGTFILSRDLQPLIECLDDSSESVTASRDDVLRCLRMCDRTHRVRVGVGTGRFVLKCRGGSIDLDGSTYFYDSDVGHWQNCHNDFLNYTDNIFAEAEAAMQYWVSVGEESLTYKD